MVNPIFLIVLARSVTTDRSKSEQKFNDSGCLDVANALVSFALVL